MYVIFHFNIILQIKGAEKITKFNLQCSREFLKLNLCNYLELILSVAIELKYRSFK